MAVLRSALDPASDDFATNASAMRRQVAELRERTATLTEGGAGGDEPFHRPPPRARQAAGARARGAADRPGQRLPGDIGPGGDRNVRRRRAGGRHGDRHRAGGRRRVRDRGQRRHRQGRHLLPHDRQEASPRAGDRAREPAAVPVPGGFGRRLPAAAGRGLPGSRALRTDLLQPGAAQLARHPADRAGDGLVHRRRGLRAGHVRRDRHRQGHRHHLPGRPAAGEGGHRRGGQRRGPGRGGGAYRRERRGRPLRAGRRACHRHRSRDRGRAWLAQAGAAVGARGALSSIGQSGRAVRRDPGRCAPQLRRARGDRPPGRRQRVPRVQGPLRRDAGLRLRADRGLPGRHPGQQRDPVQQLVAEGRPLRGARQPAPHPARLPAEHHRLHGRPRVRGRRASPRTAPSW